LTVDLQILGAHHDNFWQFKQKLYRCKVWSQLNLKDHQKAINPLDYVTGYVVSSHDHVFFTFEVDSNVVRVYQLCDWLAEVSSSSQQFVHSVMNQYCASHPLDTTRIESTGQRELASFVFISWYHTLSGTYLLTHYTQITEFLYDAWCVTSCWAGKYFQYF
jgi:hypothetical protein